MVVQNAPRLNAATRKKIQSQANKNTPEQLQFIFGASVGVEAEQFLSVCVFDRLPQPIEVRLCELLLTSATIAVHFKRIDELPPLEMQVFDEVKLM